MDMIFFAYFQWKHWRSTEKALKKSKSLTICPFFFPYINNPEKKKGGGVNWRGGDKWRKYCINWTHFWTSYQHLGGAPVQMSGYCNEIRSLRKRLVRWTTTAKVKYNQTCGCPCSVFFCVCVCVCVCFFRVSVFILFLLSQLMASIIIADYNSFDSEPEGYQRILWFCNSSGLWASIHPAPIKPINRTVTHYWWKQG